MDKFIDLHTHSTASDGSMSPGELVRHAKAKGLSAIALTDHDTIVGVDEAIEAGKKIGIEVIPGVEISTDFKPEMHILGYFFNDIAPAFNDILLKLRQNRFERNPKIINKLKDMGINITIEEVEAEGKGNVIGRPHIAKVLLNKGYVKSMEEAFDKFLASGKAAYFKKDKLSPEEGIEAILKGGGIPILAHPIFLGITLKELDNLLEVLKEKGIKGIEAVYVENTREDTGNLLRLAIKHDLLVTGGSDFHGSYKPDIEIGIGRGSLSVSYELLHKLRNSYESYILVAKLIKFDRLSFPPKLSFGGCTALTVSWAGIESLLLFS
jgi:3',5'-nucleoside bisphosphate phosphatase